MKKICLSALLLLLLIIYCVKSKIDQIHISSNTVTQTHEESAKKVLQPSNHIEYTITQEDDTYIVNGHFTNDKQQARLSKIFEAHNKVLNRGDITNNKTLISKDAVSLTEKILPHFIEHYEKGRIEYNNQTLHISGEVSEYEVKHEMQRLLSTSILSSQNNSDVVLLSKAPIQINLVKTDENSLSTTENEEVQLSQEIIVQQTTPDQEKTETIEAKNTQEEGKASIIKLLESETIEFFIQTANLTYKGKKTIDKLADILKEYPQLNIEIAGYAAKDGIKTFNLKLSQDRADTVKEVLILLGMNKNQLFAKGYGKIIPLTPNTTSVNQKKNRHVEINFIGE